MFDAAPGVTVTLALPDTLPEVATTVPVPDTVAVNKPLVLMFPIPPVTDQVGATATVLLKLSFPSALNCLVVPDATVVGLGVTDMLTKVGLGDGVGVGLAVAEGDGLTVAVGDGLAVDVGLAVAVGVGLTVAEGVELTVAEGVGLTVAVGLGVTVGVGVSVDVGPSTVIVAPPTLSGSLFDLAAITALPEASPVTSPLDDTVATDRLDEDQVTSLSVVLSP